MTLQDNVQKVCDTFSNELKEAFGDVFAQNLHEGMVCTGAEVDEDGFPTVTFKVHTNQEWRNGHDIVHGGCLATIVDFYTSLAMAGDPNNWSSDQPSDQEFGQFLRSMGVSRNLQAQYVQAAPINADVIVKCKVLSNTKRNAYLQCFIFDQKGKLLVVGMHDKAKQVVKL